MKTVGQAGYLHFLHHDYLVPDNPGLENRQSMSAPLSLLARRWRRFQLALIVAAESN